MNEVSNLLARIIRLDEDLSARIVSNIVNKWEKSQWEYFFELCQDGKVEPIVWYRLNYLGLGNCRQLEKIKHSYNKVASKLEIKECHLRRILELFHKEGIRLYLLKGVCFGVHIYKNLNYKKMNDFDVLVKREDRKRAQECLKKLEFKSIGKLFGEFHPLGEHHDPPYINTIDMQLIGLHCELINPNTNYKLEMEELFSRCKLEAWNGLNYYRLSYEDNLLHLCLHLPYYKIGLRELMDIINLWDYARIRNAFDYKLFEELVEKSSAIDPVYRVLSLCCIIWPDMECFFPLKRWKVKSSRVTVSDTLKFQHNTKLLFRARSTYVSQLEKYYVIFALTDHPMEKLYSYFTLWKKALFPPIIEVSKIWVTHKVRWWHTRTFFLRIWRAMARDHGSMALTVLTLKNFYICFISVFKVLSRRKWISIKNHPHFSLMKQLE